MEIISNSNRVMLWCSSQILLLNRGNSFGCRAAWPWHSNGGTHGDTATPLPRPLCTTKTRPELVESLQAEFRLCEDISGWRDKFLNLFCSCPAPSIQPQLLQWCMAPEQGQDGAVHPQPYSDPTAQSLPAEMFQFWHWAVLRPINGAWTLGGCLIEESWRTRAWLGHCRAWRRLSAEWWIMNFKSLC